MRRMQSDGFTCLVRLWRYTAVERPLGVLSGLDIEGIEIAAAYTGAEGALVACLTDLGLLDVGQDGVYSVHDWKDHNPWAFGAIARSQAARNAALAKWNGVSHDDRIAHADKMVKARSTSGPHVDNMPSAMRNDAGRNADNMRPAMPLSESDSESDSDSESTESPLNPPGGNVQKPKRVRKKREFDKLPLHDPAGFLRFREIYPRDVDWPDAAKAWDEVQPTEEDKANIERLCARYCGMKLSGEDAKHIKGPAPWLRIGRHRARSTDGAFPGHTMSGGTYIANGHKSPATGIDRARQVAAMLDGYSP